MSQQQGNAATLTNLFNDLNKLAQNAEWDKALKVANKILQLPETREDATTFHCKIVCLLQLERFSDVLNHINRNPELSIGLEFEKAYSLYRLYRTRDSLDVLRNVENPSERVTELLGQVLYRLEEYDECFSIYRQLMKNLQDDYEEEREINLTAVMAGLQMSGTTDIDEYDLREDSHELCYNAACFLLGKGLYKEALEKLKKAEQLCRESFADDPDATEDEINDELGSIRVQMGFALQKLGRNSEALQLYNLVTKQKPTDAVLNAVASNNVVTVNKDQNVFDSKKKMKNATVDSLQQKLTSKQQQSIGINHSLLYLYTNQGEQCKSSLKNLKETYPENETFGLVEAAQLVREKNMPGAVETLQQQIDNSSGDAINLKLVLAQLHLSSGHVYKACDALRDLGDYSYKPGVVSALVSLYVSQEDKSAASEVLNSTIDWYKDNQPNAEELTTIIRANANFQLRHGDPMVATKMLEEMRKRDPSDLKVLAQLISAYSKFDPQKAHEVSKQLPSAEELAQDVDVDALESSVMNLTRRRVGKDTSPSKPLSPKSGSSAVELKKKKKRKKGKLPKNLNAEIDPERWVPLRERSYYRGKRKKGKRDAVGKGTQGGVTQAMMNELDATRSTGDTSVGSPKDTPVAAQGPRQQKPPGANQQRKKKKGKSKW